MICRVARPGKPYIQLFQRRLRILENSVCWLPCVVARPTKKSGPPSPQISPRNRVRVLTWKTPCSYASETFLRSVLLRIGFAKSVTGPGVPFAARPQQTRTMAQGTHGKIRSENAMRHTFPRKICTILISLVSVSAIHAQSGDAPAEMRSFAGQYVAAINTKDAARLRALYDSPSRACIAAENKDFYNTTLAGLWPEPIPAKHTLTVSVVDENNLKAIETFGRFSVKPSRELHIDYPQGDDLRTVVLYLVEENGHWVADQPCPTAEAIKNFHDNAAAREHYKAVAQSIQERAASRSLATSRIHFFFLF